MQNRKAAVAVLRAGALADHRSVDGDAGEQVGARGFDDAMHGPEPTEVGEMRCLLGVPVLGVDDIAAGRTGVGNDLGDGGDNVLAPSTYSDPLGSPKSCCMSTTISACSAPCGIPVGRHEWALSVFRALDRSGWSG